MDVFNVHPVRSISLPSRQNPVAEQIDEQLSRLRSCQSACSSSSISRRLGDVKELYGCVDRLLQLSNNRQVEQSIDEVLETSVRLLDCCSASRDALQMSKERLQDVQSALRRRGEVSVVSEVAEYLNARRIVKKAVKKTLKSLKTKTDEAKQDGAHATLTDVQAATADALLSLLSYVAGAHKSGWSAVAKLITKNAKAVMTINSGFDDVDATLNTLVCQKKNGVTSSQMEDLRSRMSKLELEIQDFDEQLEGLFRNLVKTRATLLNIISY